MPWTLSASGHAPTPDDEAALLARLHTALAHDAAGTHMATFTGTWHTCCPHHPPLEEASHAP